VAKLLRLDVAQLTDVGRKREHNEDNMAYVIPKDPAVMAHKGALFIVADGMGGHAAGEVASEIAVDTVSNAYYQDDNEDVTTALLNAIRRANAAIHQRAAENMLRSGMGTTCVVAVLRGNMAYIANVGDSRAYLIRKSQIRQISQDHSWVAEQVRAGLLTEEQARTHAQRNVITRSLGTQAEVEIDLFREVLEEGDTLILCSDGLSGLVNDEELLRMVDQFAPQESVYHLVERANENGGPDNITAIVTRVQELGVEPPSVRQPVPIGGPQLSNEDTARIFAPAGAGVNLATRNGEAPLSGRPFPYTSGPLDLPESDTAPQPALKTKKQHGRLFYPTIALVLLFVLAAGFSGFYYFLHTYQNSTINSTLNSTTQLISQASNEVNHNPTQALQDLSKAQQQLQDLQKNYTLGSSSAARLANLQTQLVNETRLAINAYNQGANITVLPCTKSAPSSLSGESVGTLALIQSGKATAYYALGQDGKIYQLIQSSNGNGGNQYTLNAPFSPNTGTQITSMVGAKEKIFALSEQMNNNTPGNYAINLLGPGQGNGLQSVRQHSIEMQMAKNGQVPGLIAAWDNGNNSFDVYVVLQSPSSSANTNNATILSYSVDTKGNFSAPKQTSISVSEPISSITATPNQLFLLIEGGEVESLPITNHTLATALIPVLTSQAIAPTLATSAQNFTASTPVPTVTSQKASTALNVPGASTATLSAGMIPNASGNPQVHLLVGDPANHRVLDLTPQPLATAGGPDSTPTATVTGNAQGANMTLTLVQQYASPGYFNSIKSVAIDSSGTTFILSQNAPGSENLLAVGPNAQSTCAS
jgi:serine/threonine protein phosphatase PrpC